jgi:hypothetical protein
MFHRWAALGLVLALSAMLPKNAAGQGTTKAPRSPGAGAIGLPHPNPFNPEIRIPFTVGDPGCTDVGLQHEVSIQIKNMLAQTVAIPVLEVGSAGGAVALPSSAGSQTPIDHLRLGCGTYSAYWSGNLLGSTKEAASGTYLVLLIVDGKPSDQTRRIFNRK